MTLARSLMRSVTLQRVSIFRNCSDLFGFPLLPPFFLSKIESSRRGRACLPLDLLSRENCHFGGMTRSIWRIALFALGDVLSDDCVPFFSFLFLFLLLLQFSATRKTRPRVYLMHVSRSLLSAR